MRITLIVIVVIFSSCSYSAKEFEGKIYYNTIVVKKPGINTTAFDSYPKSSVYSYKNGKYRWDYNDSSYQMSDPDRNFTVLKYQNNDTLFKIICLPQDTLLSYKLTKNADTICGYICDRLEAQVTSAIFHGTLKRTYWFNSQLYAYPEHFRNDSSFATYQLVSIS